MDRLQTILEKSKNKGSAGLVMAQVLDELQKEDGMYTVITRATKHFYMGVANAKPAAYIFTNKEYADEFAQELTQNGIQAKTVEIRVPQRAIFFNDLYRSGFEALVINQGYAGMAMSLFTIIEKPEDSDAVINPELMCAALHFYQAMATQSASSELQDVLCTKLYNAKFLYPVASKRARIPALINDTKGRQFCPIFSDPVEFGKFDKAHKYYPKEVKFRDLKKLLNKTSGVVLNPFGFGLQMGAEKLEHIEKDNMKLKVVK